MASFVINGLMTCNRPLSERQRAILFFAVLWEMALLEDETMTTDDGYYLSSHAQYGIR